MRRNLSRVRELAPRSRVWAVVKANAYGHGLRAAMAGFASADGLALVEFDAALRLREAGWRGPIMMLEGAFDPSDVRTALEHRLSLVFHDGAQLDWLEQAAPGGGAIDVMIKFNSGMNRLGFDADGLRRAHARLRACVACQSITLITHFANSDQAGGVDSAVRAFERAGAGLAGERSMANSAAIIDHPGTHADWVRPGIMLYGATPFDARSAASVGLTPVMTLRSRLIAVQTVRRGDAVGYGAGFVADRPMRIGVVACGYADGYPRHAPGGTPIDVQGVRTVTVGRVSMDMITVDLSPVPQAAVGALVELWGTQIPVDEVARAAGTIGWELTCALAQRVSVVVQD